MKKELLNDKYIVYSDGSLYSCISEKFLKGKYISRRYRYKAVDLTNGGKRKTYYIHRLVAEAFIPNPNNLPQINHIDGDTKNNHVTNLEWCTGSENQKHAYNTGLYKKQKCTRCGTEKYHAKEKAYVCSKCREKIISEWVKNRNKDKKCSKFKNICSPDDKDKNIIKCRVAGMTYEQIGGIFNISRQRVAQILKRYI